MPKEGSAHAWWMGWDDEDGKILTETEMKTMEGLEPGLKVHYVQPNGAHSEATVTKIHNKDTGVVDLRIVRDDTIKDEYDAKAVVYFSEPIAYSWHFIEPEETQNEDTSNS